MKTLAILAALLMSTAAFAGIPLNGIEINGQNLNGVTYNGASAQRTAPAKVAPAKTGVRVQNAAARQGKLYVR